MLVLGGVGIIYQPGLSPLDALAGVGTLRNVTFVEVPNGVITIFTYSGAVIAELGKEGIYLRGLRMVPGIDYNVLSQTQIQFLAAQIPQTGDDLRADLVEALF